MESEESEHEHMSVPSHFKKYTIEERKIVTQQPIRSAQNLGESYDGPENAKKINLANEGEEPKPAYIATDLDPEEEALLIETLKEYKDVFAWSYKDLKGVDPTICQHTIPVRTRVLGSSTVMFMSLGHVNDGVKGTSEPSV